MRDKFRHRADVRRAIGCNGTQRHPGRIVQTVVARLAPKEIAVRFETYRLPDRNQQVRLQARDVGRAEQRREPGIESAREGCGEGGEAVRIAAVAARDSGLQAEPWPPRIAEMRSNVERGFVRMNRYRCERSELPDRLDVEIECPRRRERSRTIGIGVIPTFVSPGAI